MPRQFGSLDLLFCQHLRPLLPQRFQEKRQRLVAGPAFFAGNDQQVPRPLYPVDGRWYFFGGENAEEIDVGVQRQAARLRRERKSEGSARPAGSNGPAEI